MKRIKISLLSAACTLFFAVTAVGQDINQAIEFNNKGAEAVKAKDWATAITELNNALAILEELGEEGEEMAQLIKDQIPSLHLFYGQELAKASNYDEAIIELQKAISTAELYDDFTSAATDAKELIDQINFSIATALFNDKKYDEAIAAFTQILETDPDNGAIYFYMGASYASLSKENEAIAAYEKAIVLGNKDAAPRLANIYLTQAQAAQRSNPPKWTTVYDLAKKALELSETTNANLLFGIAAVETKKYQEAITALDKVLTSETTEQNKGNAIYRLAIAYEGLGKKSEACGFYKQLLNNATFKEIAKYKVETELKCQ